jgi:carbon monoxide dehydrogenase subunit G
MLRFEGDRIFQKTPDIVWTRLTDPAFLVSCVPDLDRVIKAEGDDVAFVIRPGLAFMRGSLEVNGKLRDKVAPTAVTYDIQSKGMGASAAVVVALTLAAEAAATKIHWVAEVKELTGLLKLVPGGLIRGAAEKVINDLWTAIEKKVAENA